MKEENLHDTGNKTSWKIITENVIELYIGNFVLFIIESNVSILNFYAYSYL